MDCQTTSTSQAEHKSFILRGPGRLVQELNVCTVLATLTLMLFVANLVNTKRFLKKLENDLNWHMGSLLNVVSRGDQ